jgi:hypothetical protein
MQTPAWCRTTHDYEFLRGGHHDASELGIVAIEMVTGDLLGCRSLLVLLGSQNAAREQAGGPSAAAREQPRSSQGSAHARSRSSLPPRSVRQPRRGRAFPHKTWPLAREILHRAIRTNQAAFEQTLVEVMRTKKGVLQVLELLAKLNREIGSRADEAPAVRIVIGGNIPLEGMRAVTPPALPVPTDPDALPGS